MDIELVNYEDTKLLRVTNVLPDGHFNTIHKIKMKDLLNSGFNVTDKTPIESSGLYYFLFLNIKKAFLSLGIENITPTGMTVSKNRGGVHWHKHKSEYKHDPEEMITEKFWVAVYYIHSELDEDGKYVDLRLSKTETGPGNFYQCVPNSCVIHNRMIGHGTDAINLPDTERVAFYSHWIEG